MKLYIRNQLYMLIRQPYFWISAAIVSAYSIINIIHYGITYYGKSALGIMTVTDLYIYNSNNSFWAVFSVLLPFVCMLTYGMQTLTDRERGTINYYNSRIDMKSYYISGATSCAIGTFLEILLSAVISTALLFVSYPQSDKTVLGTRYTEVYWLNIQSGYRTHFVKLYALNPIIYLLIMSLIFSIFCSVMAVFFYAVSIVAKRKIHMILAAGIMSYAILQIYLATGYDIYGDVTASIIGWQSGIPTIIFMMLMLLISVVIVKYQITKQGRL